MRTKDPKSDSGKYINGVYITKNGCYNSGLSCPKGVRLYDTSVKHPIFFEPEQTYEGEEFRSITEDIEPTLLPYYAISNYGRLLNKFSGKILKENFRPNGYSYYCLLSIYDGTKQRKYSTHRLEMKVFKPESNMENKQVNHKDGNKSNNYIENLEWVTPSQNCIHRDNILLANKRKVSDNDAEFIRELHSKYNFTYKDIQEKYFPNISTTAIQNICKYRSHNN